MTQANAVVAPRHDLVRLDRAEQALRELDWPTSEKCWRA